MPLRFALRFNVAWACLLALAFGAVFVDGPGIRRAAAFAAAIAFVAVSVDALRGYRWAVVTALSIAGVLLAVTLPYVLFNVWKFATDDPMYLDSPGTILVVAIEGLLLTLPPLVILTAAWVARRPRTSQR